MNDLMNLLKERRTYRRFCRAGDFEYDAGSVESWGRKLYHRRVQPAKAFGAVWIDGGSEAAYGGGIWLSIPYQQD